MSASWPLSNENFVKLIHCEEPEANKQHDLIPLSMWRTPHMTNSGCAKEPQSPVIQAVEGSIATALQVSLIRVQYIQHSLGLLMTTSEPRMSMSE